VWWLFVPNALNGPYPLGAAVLDAGCLRLPSADGVVVPCACHPEDERAGEEQAQAGEDGAERDLQAVTPDHSLRAERHCLIMADVGQASRLPL